jgi:hypothetical protein
LILWISYFAFDAYFCLARNLAVQFMPSQVDQEHHKPARCWLTEQSRSHLRQLSSPVAASLTDNSSEGVLKPCLHIVEQSHDQQNTLASLYIQNAYEKVSCKYDIAGTFTGPDPSNIFIASSSGNFL